MTIHLADLLNAFLLTIVFVRLLTLIAEPIGLVDLPVGRKRHEGSIPVIGGLAMFAAFAGACLAAGLPLRAPVELLAALACLVMMGAIDDLFDLPPRFKLVVQSLAVLVMIVPGWRVIEELGLPGLSLGALAFPFTFFFMLGMINAFNMLDGLDGLAGGVTAAAFFWLAVVSACAGGPHLPAVLLLLAAVAGFLLFNAPLPWRRKAAVFMGDAGSLMLGAAVAFFVTDLSAGSSPAAPITALIYICALPAIDTMSLIVRRLAAGRSPMAPDRQHLHHLLLECGLSPAKTTAVIASLIFALGGIGSTAAMLGVSAGPLLLGLIGIAAAHTSFVVQRNLTSRIAYRGRDTFRGKADVATLAPQTEPGEQPG